MKRRPLLLAAGVFGAGLLGGCAGLDSVGVEVATHGAWPAGRAPGRFRFDRLPSQQADSQRAAAVEAAALSALSAAGFRAAAGGETAEFVVQLGLRWTRLEPDPLADPLWWRGMRRWPHAAPLTPWHGPWASPWEASSWPLVHREAMLLIRDAASGQVLFEARARHQSHRSGDGGLSEAMFRAALDAFPRIEPVPREVRVSLPQHP